MFFNTQDEFTTFKDYNTSGVVNDLFYNGKLSLSNIGYVCGLNNKLTIECKNSATSTPFMSLTNENSEILDTGVRVYCPYKIYVTKNNSDHCNVYITGVPRDYRTTQGTSTIKTTMNIINNNYITTGSTTSGGIIPTTTNSDIGIITGRSINNGSETYYSFESPFLLFIFITILLTTCLYLYFNSNKKK